MGLFQFIKKMNNIKKLFTSKKTINIPFQLFFILNAIMIGILNASVNSFNISISNMCIEKILIDNQTFLQL